MIKITSTAFLAIALLASCGEKQNKDSKATLAELKKQQKEIQDKIASLELENMSKDSNSIRKVAVEVTPMAPSVFNNYIDVQGKIDLDEVVNAIPETPGIISAILVHQGQYVRKGQVVATLRAEQVDRGISELDQQISFAKLLYDKQKRLWDQEIGTEIQLLQAKNNYDGLLKKRLRFLPLSGICCPENVFPMQYPLQNYSQSVATVVEIALNFLSLIQYYLVPTNFPSVIRMTYFDC